MKDSEILKQIISLAFDSNPSDCIVTLSDALDLYGRVLLGEQTAPAFMANTMKAPAAKKEQATRTFTPVGKGSVEKKATYERLLKFKEANGLGSYEMLAKASKGALTVDEIRMMAGAEKVPLSKWTALEKALDGYEVKKE